MDSNDQLRNPLEELAEEFMHRRRMGEKPTVQEYATKHPQLADEIFDLFPTLEMMEHVREDVVDKTVVNFDRQSNVGERLGDYQVLREIGRGGMGVVYEAHQSSLGRRVALKVLAHNLQRNAKYLERFKREARAAAKLQHSNIVPVYGVGEDNGFHFYAMQYIHGRGLDEVLQAIQIRTNEKPVHESDTNTSTNDLANALATGQFRIKDLDDASSYDSGTTGSRTSAIADTQRRFSRSGTEYSAESDYIRRVAELGLQVASALSHAHGKGVLHRDIKPSNLLLDVYGNIWITDFGLVKMIGEEDLTETGDVVGTLRYISPESLRGDYDARSDIYGLGLTIHELLAREKAFGAANRAELTNQILERGAIALKNVPKDLGTIVQKATAIEPGDRYQSASDFADDLNRFLTNRPILARQISAIELLWRWSKRNRLLAASLATVATLLIVGLVGSTIASMQLSMLAGENKTAFLNAANESREAKRRLVEANILRAEGLAGSGLPGQRVDGLNAIAESVPIARELEMGESTLLRLRSAAISCMANSDVVPVKDWQVTSATVFEAAFDESLERYAVLSIPGGPIDVRNVADNSFVASVAAKPNSSLFWLSPCGKYLAIWSITNLEIWKIDDHRKIHQLGKTDFSYSRFQFDRSSQRFACSTTDGFVRVYELEKQQPLFEIQSDASCVCFTETNRIAVCRELQGPGMLEQLQQSLRQLIQNGPSNRKRPAAVVEIFDLESGTRETSLSLSGRPHRLGYSNGLLAVACSRDVESNSPHLRAHNFVEVFELPHQDPICQIDHNRIARIRQLQIVGDDQVLALGFGQGTTELWDLRTGSKLLITNGDFLSGSGDKLTYKRFGNLGIQKMVLAKEFRHLVSGTATQRIKVDTTNRIFVMLLETGLRICDSKRGALLAQDVNHQYSNATFSADGKSLYVVVNRQHVKRMPLTYAKNQITIGPPVALTLPDGFHPHHLATDKRGKILVAEDPTGSRIAVFDLTRNKDPVLIDSPPYPLFISVSDDARWAATGTWHGGYVGIYNLSDNALVKTIPYGRTEVCFTPDNRHLFCGAGRLIDLETWDERPVYMGDKKFQFAAPCVAADGSFVVASEQHPLGSSIIYDPDTWIELARLRTGRRDSVIGLSPDGVDLFIKTMDDNYFSINAWNLFEVRKRLKELNLDWALPDYEPTQVTGEPVKVELRLE